MEREFGMLEGSQAGEREMPREGVRDYVDEGTTCLRTMQAGHISGYRDRNGKPKKNSQNLCSRSKA